MLISFCCHSKVGGAFLEDFFFLFFFNICHEEFNFGMNLNLKIVLFLHIIFSGNTQDLNVSLI